MIYVARIESGTVVQVTVEPYDYQPEPGHVLIGPDNVVGIGWAWDGTSFDPPPQVILAENEHIE